MFGANLWHWSHFLTYWATSNLEWELCVTMICLLYDFHISLHAIPPKVDPLPRDGHKAMVLKKSVYTIFVLWITRNGELSSISFLPPHSQEVTCPISKIELWNLDLEYLDLRHLFLGKPNQIFNEDDSRNVLSRKSYQSRQRVCIPVSTPWVLLYREKLKAWL